MEDRYLVAVDLGSSKTALSVAYVEGGSMSIIYYKELPSAGIRNSGIFNETQAAGVVRQLVNDAEAALGIKVTQIVTGLSRNGIVTVDKCSDAESRDRNTVITAGDIQALKTSVTSSYRCENERLTVYAAVAQSYSNGEDINLNEEDIIGTSGTELTGDFKIFLGNSRSMNCIANMMHLNDLVSAKEYFTPEIIGNAVLCDDEIENGVAVIDLGGGCTSVSIFIGGILRFYSSVPFGGKEVTSDIRTESNISERLAENIKLGYGACIPEKLLNMTDKQLLIKSDTAEPDKRLSLKYLSEIITAREEELLEAMIYEIDRSGFSKQIPSGIVITGGGANMTNLEMLITRMSGYRVRIGFPQKAQGISECNGILETSAATSVALLSAALNDSVGACAVPSQEYAKEPEITVVGGEEKKPDNHKDVSEAANVGEVKSGEQGNIFGSDPDYVTETKPKKQAKEQKKKRLFGGLSDRFKEVIGEATEFGNGLFDEINDNE